MSNKQDAKIGEEVELTSSMSTRLTDRVEEILRIWVSFPNVHLSSCQ